jgi:hypothetical protein
MKDYDKDKKMHYGINLKPDALCHKGPPDRFAKDAKLPGQMYVPRHVHNESVFAAEDYNERKERSR